MRKLFVFVLVCSIATSCSQFKSKTTLLTEQEWLLYKKNIIREDGAPSIIYHKKINTSRFKFEKDGILKVSIDEKSYHYVQWKWHGENEIIIYYGDNLSSLYEIEELDSDTFRWKQAKFKYGVLGIEEFKKENSKDWRHHQ